MNKIEKINKIIGDSIFSHGFKIYNSDKNEGIRFVRERGDLKQFIDVQIIHSKYLALKFNTNAYQQKTIDGSEFYPDKKVTYLYPGLPIPKEWWLWNNEEEFVDILNTFKDIILERGLNALEEISAPSTEKRPTEKTNLELFQKHSDLNREYRILMGIENETSTRKVLEKINEVIQEYKNKDFKEIENNLVGLAAVYGEELISRRGGEWQWREDYGNICWIDKMRGDISGTYPLNDIIYHWREGKDSINYFLDMFRTSSEENI